MRQDQRVLHQVGDIEHQAATSRLAVQHSKAVRYAEHPGGGGTKAVREVVAVVKKGIGRVAAFAPLDAREVAVRRGRCSQAVQLLGQARLLGQQRSMVGRIGDAIG